MWTLAPSFMWMTKLQQISSETGKEKKEMNKKITKKITWNAICCIWCKEVLVSTHVHDFKQCHCGSVGVDGGNEYLRRIGNPDDYIELSTYAER
jgi:hypothetical protein